MPQKLNPKSDHHYLRLKKTKFRQFKIETLANNGEIRYLPKTSIKDTLNYLKNLKVHDFWCTIRNIITKSTYALLEQFIHGTLDEDLKFTEVSLSIKNKGEIFLRFFRY